MTESRTPNTASSIGEWAESIHHLAKEKGWWDPPSYEQAARQADLATIALMHGLLSEATEAVRRGEPLIEVLRDKPEMRTLWAAAGGIKDDMQARFHRSETLVGMLASIALMHSELSEAGSCVTRNDIQYREGPDGKPEGMVTEICDAIIRGLDFLRRHRLDAAMAIWKKHTFNRSRPYRHGKVV